MADAFDAMTTDRAYRRALTNEEAVAELQRGRGSQFDPAIVDAFLRARSSARSGDAAAKSESLMAPDTVMAGR